MEYRKFNDTYIVRIQRGEEILTQLTELCRKEKITLAAVEGIGAADRVVMGLYNVEEQVYHKTELTGEMEITSLLGNISEMNGGPYLHLHINVAGADGITRGGHLNEAVISATCEISIRCIDGHVGRERSEEIGINLYKFDRT